MNILFLSLYSFTKLNEGYIYADLINQFVQNGHNVIAVSIQSGTGVKTYMDETEGFKHIFLRTGKIQKTSKIKKAINLITLDGKTIRAIKRFVHCKFDMIIPMVSNLCFYKTVAYFKKRDDAFVYNLLKDIFPQNAVDMEFMSKNGFIHKYYSKKENKYYHISDKIGCLSPANVKILSKIDSLQNKVEENPNSIIPKETILSEEEKYEIKKFYNLPPCKTIFLYGGNLGIPQGVEYLIECIKKNEERNDSYFLIMGSGTKFEELKLLIKKNGFKNCGLYPSVSQNEFKRIIQVCDVGLVFLNNKFTIPNFPSRILSYLEGGLPLIFAVDKSCDAGLIAEENGFGFNTLNGDIDDFFQKIKLLLDEKISKSMGKIGYDYLRKHYIVNISYNKIMESYNEYIQR